MSQRTITTCDRCGREGDVAWYLLSAVESHGDCAQPPIKKAEICGACRASLTGWWGDPEGVHRA